MPGYLIPAKIGVGFEEVALMYAFEVDENGIYNTELQQVFFQNMGIISCLTDETILELECEAAKWVDDKIAQDKDEAQIAKWEENNEN